MTVMKFFRTSRRPIALIAAYALALQPLVATLAWTAHASSLVPGQAVICQDVAPGGNDGRGTPTGQDRVCGYCTAASCGTTFGVADLPRPVIGLAPVIAQPAVSVTEFTAAPRTSPAERYRSRAPPAA
jgi:hypothetical protein